MWKQSEFVSLTWVYYIYYYSLGSIGGRLAIYFLILTNKCQATIAQATQRV